MDRIGLFLVDPNQLFREGLKRLLDERQYAIVGEARSLGQASAALAGGQPIDLLVLDFEGEETDGYAPLIQQIRLDRPDIKIIALTADRSRNSLVNAIHWSLDAYLSKDMPPDALIRSFQLVMIGQQIFPTKLMASLMDPNAGEQSANERIGAAKGLSPREVQILHHLVNGQSNKAIARELCISEATVKVHLKALLRKVRVNNRTQAAVWALNQGINQETAEA